MATATEILPEVDDDITDPDDFAHYIRIKSLIKGGPQVALCGKKFIPTIVGQEVFNKPVHPVCELLFNMLDKD